jgi:hypothetical protein
VLNRDKGQHSETAVQGKCKSSGKRGMLKRSRVWKCVFTAPDLPARSPYHACCAELFTSLCVERRAYSEASLLLRQAPLAIRDRAAGSQQWGRAPGSAHWPRQCCPPGRPPG